MTDRELMLARDRIHKACGLWFQDGRIEFLRKKLEVRIQASGAGGFRQYMAVLKNENDKSELERLFNALTVNETYFFRIPGHFRHFKEAFLPELMQRKAKEGNRSVNVWSAGCATGEEAYSIAISLLEAVTFPSIWTLRVLATDLSTAALIAAEQGEYGAKSVGETPEAALEKHFQRNGSRRRIGDAARRLVEFEYANLIDGQIHERFDAIFCRNVLIYFKREDRTETLARLHDALLDGGMLYLGASETVWGQTDKFEAVSCGESVCFRKKTG